MEDTHVLIFRLSDIGRSALKREERQELCEEIFQKLTVITDEDEVHGLQLYPQKWLKSVHLSLKNESSKSKVLVEGLSVFGKHVELQDDSESAIIKVTVYDAPMGMTNEKLKDIFSKYGDVIKVEDEMHVFNGRVTSWSTGNRIVSMTVIRQAIPTHMTGNYKGQLISINTWHRGQGQPSKQVTEMRRCIRCGLNSHDISSCAEKEKLCFTCKEPGHISHNCPINSNAKAKMSEKENCEILCYLGKDSIFSNLNTKFPVTINGTSYICNEQYIQHSKAMLFHDQECADKIMSCDNPYEVRALGRNIAGFRYWDWKRHAIPLTKQCIRGKFEKNPEAKEALLATENKIIAEASKDTFWGCGVHITDKVCLDRQTWVGKNQMGIILMHVRDGLAQSEPNGRDIDHCDYNDDVMETDGKCVVDLKTGGDENVETNVEEKIQLVQSGGEGNEMGDKLDNNDKQWSDFENDIDSIESDNTSSVIETEVLDEMSSSFQNERKYVMVIGDSNCRDILYDVPFNTEKQVLGGTAIFDVDELLGETTVPANKVTNVVLHVGTCDFDPARTNKVDTIYTEYVECIHNVQLRYPGADIIISGVLPRAPRVGRKNEKLNGEILELNRKLSLLQKEVSSIMFVDHDLSFVEKGMVRQNLYRQTDKTGVHINERGSQALSENLVNAIVEQYYKRKLAIDYDVVPTTSIAWKWRPST